jgi:Ca-activated chloride channel family protein
MITKKHDAHDVRPYIPGFVFVVFIVAFVVSPLAQTFRFGVYTVFVSVTVTDANGRLITGLSQNDFEVFEGGDRQPITQFTNQRVPVSLGVMLDASDSMRGQPMIDARTAVDRFVGDLLDPGDQAFVGVFNHRPRIVVPWTQPPAQLRDRLVAERPTGGTAIYDALAATVPMFERREHQRAALVVISDGADTASDNTLGEARDALRRSDAFVYAIAIDGDGERPATRVNPEALREITGQSGGYTEIVRSAADVAPATERIARELNSQYGIGFTTPRPPDGSYRFLRVRMKSPGHYARARRGYFAFPRPS